MQQNGESRNIYGSFEYEKSSISNYWGEDGL